MSNNFENIPEELRNLKQWLCWNRETRDGKETKVPYIPNTKKRASSTNSSTWKTFDEAIMAYRTGKHAGIGFVFTDNDKYCFIDLDKCRNTDTGEIESWAMDIIHRLNAYTEISQSGSGIHIIVIANLPESSHNREGNFEIYTRGRYGALTGKVLQGFPIVIEERQEQINQICAEIFGKPELTQKTSKTELSTSTLSDQEILEKARKSANADKFNMLMAGQWQGKYPSPSEADEALCCELAFWTRDIDQIDRLFKQSGLYREKWDREDYRHNTINSALELISEHYHYKAGGVKVEPFKPKDKNNNPKISEPDKHKSELQAILCKHDLNTDTGKKSVLYEADSYIKGITNPKIAGKLWDIVNKELNITDDERYTELTFKSAEELGKMELPEVSWIVPGYIPEGLTLLCGKPKTGKSWLALGLAIAISSGGRAFGSIPMEEYQGKVLYLALEDNERRLKERLTKLCQGAAFPKDLFYTTEIDRGYEGVKKISAWLNKYPKDSRLVVIDTFVSFRGKAGSKTANEYDRDSSDMQLLQQLAGKFGIGIIVIHHQRKAIAEDDFDTISGTLGLTGKADTNFILKRGRGEADAILKGTGRDLEDDIDLALKFDRSIASWVLLGNATEYLISKERQEIIALFKTINEPLSPKQIADNLNKNQNTIRGLLSKMISDGTLKQQGYGKYIINTVNSINSINNINTVNSGENS